MRCSNPFHLFNFLVFILREGTGGRGEDREVGLAPSRAPACLIWGSNSPKVGLEPTNREIVSQSHDLLNQLSHPGAPVALILYDICACHFYKNFAEKRNQQDSDREVVGVGGDLFKN